MNFSLTSVSLCFLLPCNLKMDHANEVLDKISRAQDHSIAHRKIDVKSHGLHVSSDRNILHR